MICHMDCGATKLYPADAYRSSLDASRIRTDQPTILDCAQSIHTHQAINRHTSLRLIEKALTCNENRHLFDGPMRQRTIKPSNNKHTNQAIVSNN
jgi:hypothetical protein